jgi:hypothetical protein
MRIFIMKKIWFYVGLCVLLLAANSGLAADGAAHYSAEAGFRLMTEAAWPRMTVAKARIGKNPAYVAHFYRAGQESPDPDFALQAVDGRKDANIRQTCRELTGGYAEIILLQLAEAEREQPAAPGFILPGSQVRQSGRNTYIVMKLENAAARTAIYRVLTAAGEGILYSINYKAPLTAAPPANLERMLATLEILGAPR